MSGIPGEGFSNRQVQLITVTSTCLVLSTLATVLRLLVRWSSAAVLWWDDWVAVLALVTSWLVNIFTISGRSFDRHYQALVPVKKIYKFYTGIRYGLGRHSPQVDPSNMTPFGVTVFVQQIAWALSTGLIILAILLFYVRIFPNKWMRRAIYIIGAWDTVWTISTVLVTAFQCTPIDSLWSRKTQGGKCINSDAFYFACSLTSTVTVVTVLFLPLPIVWKLQVPISRRIGLAISFSIGAFTCIAIIVRLVVLLDIDPEDFMYTSTLPQLWSCVEVSFGVISACLPSLTTLFLVLLGKRPSSSRHRSVSFSRHHDGRIRNAGFNHIADATDGDAQSQSIELVRRIFDASDDVTNLDGSWGSILVTRRVDQVTHMRTDQAPEPEQMEVVADASALNI